VSRSGPSTGLTVVPVDVVRQRTVAMSAASRILGSLRA
jgi:hypothetical protein